MAAPCECSHAPVTAFVLLLVLKGNLFIKRDDMKSTLLQSGHVMTDLLFDCIKNKYCYCNYKKES